MFKNLKNRSKSLQMQVGNTFSLTYSSSDLAAVLFYLINTRRRHSLLSHRPYCKSLKNYVSLFQGFFREGKGGCSIRIIRMKWSFLEALSSCLVSYKIQLRYPFEVYAVSRNHFLSCFWSPSASQQHNTYVWQKLPIYCPSNFRVYSQVPPSEWHDFMWVANIMLCLLYPLGTQYSLDNCLGGRQRLPGHCGEQKNLNPRSDQTLIFCPPPRRQLTVGYGTNCAGTLNKQGNIRHRTEKWRNERVCYVGHVGTDSLKRCNITYV